MFLQNYKQEIEAHSRDIEIEKQYKKYGIPYSIFDAIYTPEEEAAICYIMAGYDVPETLADSLLATKSERENRYKPERVSSWQSTLDKNELLLLGKKLQAEEKQRKRQKNREVYFKIKRNIQLTLQRYFRKSVT